MNIVPQNEPAKQYTDRPLSDVAGSAWNDFALDFRAKLNKKCFAFRFKEGDIVWSAIADPTTKPRKGCRVIDTAQREVSTYLGQSDVVPIVHLEASFN